MGLNQVDQNLLYLSASAGYLRNKEKNILARSYSGTLKSIRQYTGTYKKEGEPDESVPKIEVRIQDNVSPQIAVIQFTEASWYSSTFFARAYGIDVTKPITIGASEEAKEDPANRKICYAWIKQGDKSIEKSTDDAFKPVKLGENKGNDWSKLVKVIPSLVKELQDKLLAANPVESTVESEAQVPSNVQHDDLPF